METVKYMCRKSNECGYSNCPHIVPHEEQFNCSEQSYCGFNKSSVRCKPIRASGVETSKPPAQPITPEPQKDDKPPADIGTKNGGGNPKPTKIRNGAINRAVKWLEKELMTRNEILMLDAEKETGISNGSIWQAVMILIKENPSKYEYYQDMTRKRHPKGIRKVRWSE